MRCDATIQILSKTSQQPIPNATIRIFHFDQELAPARTDATGCVHLTLTPTSEIQIEAAGHHTLRQSIMIDYDPVNECLESCFSGRWRTPGSCWQPGQVPWSAFRLHDLRKQLTKIDWKIQLQAI